MYFSVSARIKEKEGEYERANHWLCVGNFQISRAIDKKGLAADVRCSSLNKIYIYIYRRSKRNQVPRCRESHKFWRRERIADTRITKASHSLSNCCCCCCHLSLNIPSPSTPTHFLRVQPSTVLEAVVVVIVIVVIVVVTMPVVVLVEGEVDSKAVVVKLSGWSGSERCLL